MVTPDSDKKPKKKTVRGRETQCLTDLKKSFESFDCFLEKIPDMPRVGDMRFQKPKPFDCFGSAMGVPIAIEGKFSDSYKSFGWSDLRESQQIGLTKFATQGARGVSMIVLFVHEPGKPPVMIWFNLLLYLPTWRTGARTSESDVRSLPTRIVARRVVRERLTRTGKKAKSYDWYYDLWPFLKDCLGSHAARLGSSLMAEELGGVSVLRHYYGSVSRPLEVPLPHAE